MIARKHKSVPIGATIASGSVGSILARLIRDIMFDIGMATPGIYHSAMNRFISRAANLPNAKKLIVARQGLSTELLKESITWKTFIHGLSFLGVKSFTLRVALKHSGGMETFHSVTSPIVESNKAGNILANLLREIFYDLSIHDGKYDELMRNFIEKTRTRDQIHSRERASIRAALSKEFLKDNITWRTFIKGLIFVNIAEFTITMTLQHRVRAETTHNLIAIIGDISTLGEDSGE